MNRITAIAILCSTAALPLLALEPQAGPPAATRSTAPDKQEWERRFHDRINNKLIWNAERSIAVGSISVGADHSHVVYWCFRETAEGSMQPFACYSFQSPDTYPCTERITPQGLELDITLPDGSHFLHFFPFSTARAVFSCRDDGFEYKTIMNLVKPFEDAPVYQEILQLNRP